MFLRLLMVWILAASAAAGAAEFHVSPRGADTAPGSPGKPFATLARAREAVRADIAGGMKQDAVVVVHGGTYFLSEPLRLDERDGGRDGRRVVYRAAAGDTPVIYNGQAVTGWQKWKGQIYRAKVEPGRRFYQLFAGERNEPLARSPNRGSGYLGGRGKGWTTYQLPAGALPEGADLADARMHVWLDFDWYAEVKAVTRRDAGGMLELAPRGGLFKLGNRAYLQGVLELLDEPGEWCLKSREGWLYYWPRRDIEKELIVAPAACRTLDIRGNSPAQPVRAVTVEGLTFIGSDFVSDFSVTGHNTFSREDGLIYLENAEKIEIRGCRILNAGIAGVYMNRHAAGNEVRNCWIERAGFAGIYMNSFPPGQGLFKTAAESYINKGHVISNNYIHDCGLLVGHGCGVQFFQAGDVEVSHNVISRMPRYGVSYKGWRMSTLPRTLFGAGKGLESYFACSHTRNIAVRYNDISSVCRDSFDFGAIESWGVGRDNVWEYNALHDIDATVSWDGWGNVMYPDDGSHHVTIRGNIVYECKGGRYGHVSMLKGIDNVFENNVIADNQLGRIISLWVQSEPGGEMVVRRNIFALGGPGQELYTTGPRRGGVIKQLDFNLVWPANRAMGKYHGYGFDTKGLEADPQFDSRHERWGRTYADYRLKPASPALKLGFVPIETDKIGLTAEFPFDRKAIFRKPAGERIQAEDYNRMSGLRTLGGSGLHRIGPGAWARYDNVDFGTGACRRFHAMLDAPPGRKVQMRLDSPAGELLGELTADGAGGLRKRTAATGKVAGVRTLFLVFDGDCYIDWFEFE